MSSKVDCCDDCGDFIWYQHNLCEECKKTATHKAHDVAWHKYGYIVRAVKEPTTGYWLAFAGALDKQGIELKIDVDAEFDTKKQALDALLKKL